MNCHFCKTWTHGKKEYKRCTLSHCPLPGVWSCNEENGHPCDYSVNPVTGKPSPCCFNFGPNWCSRKTCN